MKHWRNNALSRTREQRVDLLGETRTGALVHIELQSTNQARMPFVCPTMRTQFVESLAAFRTSWCYTSAGDGCA